MTTGTDARPDAALSAAKQALLQARLRGEKAPALRLHGAAAASIPRRAPGVDAPLSFQQERLWFLDRLQPGLAVYNLPAALRLSGAIDVDAAERALGEVVRRHEALRTTFREVDGAPVQIAHPFGGFTLPVDDAPGEGELRRRMADEAARPFDLAAGPLFRARLFRIAADDHVLLLCMHHAVGDGWSGGVLARELSALYAAFRDGRPSPLPELPIQYGDYAAWQRAQLRGEALEGDLAWWASALAGAPERLELPADRPRPAVQSYRGATEPVDLPLDVARLEALGRAEGATLFMVLLAAFTVLLSRHAGTDDVVVGSPVAGRTRRELEGLIGVFINTLVLRTDLSGDPPFREVLRRVRAGVLAAYAHQDVPFEKLVAELGVERSLGHAPLVQAMLIVQNEDPAAAGDSPVRTVDVQTGTARLDLTLTLVPTAGGLAGGLEYAADLFEPATVRRMIGHLGRVLEQAAADPRIRLSALALMDDGERDRLLQAGTGPALAPAPDPLIHALVEAQAARTPDAVALVYGEDGLTYAELDVRANRLAHHLVRRGAGPETRVGIHVERSAEMVVAMLATLKAGAAYVPLDAAYPPERLAFMLADSGASVLVTQDALAGRLSAEGLRIVRMDADAAEIDAHPSTAPRAAVDARNAAYVIYTSGSTGRPKGVLVTHANVAAFFAGMDGRIGGSRPGTWLAVTRIGFDIHVLELLWTLARGFRVVVQPDGVADDDAPARMVRRHGVTHLQCTPSLASMMIARDGTEALAGLERLLLGGEALPADLAARVTAVLPDGLVNLYGPTETTVWSTTHAVEPGTETVPIGRPIAGTRVYVLDAGLRPQPAGVPGELCIGGAGVARGYWGRAALTAEHFVPDPFAAEPGARMYRTGDRARWVDKCVSALVRECGSGSRRDDASCTRSTTHALTHSRTHALEFLGRLDAQVKIRGFRVEPGEIEAAIRTHPAVQDCAVVAREAAPGDLRLAAYVVGEVDADALRAHLRRSLPDYMVPGPIVRLDALPLTPGGKRDRRALPAPATAGDARRLRPETELEARVAALWQDLLGVDEVGAEDSFFDLGGHSLLLIPLQARLAKELGREVAVVELFQYPTVRALAARLQGQADAGAVEEGEARGGARQAAVGRRLEARRQRDEAAP